MSTTYLYLSLIPEALIASMLSPEEFGIYYAVGSHKKLRGQAMFIELDPDFRHEFFRIEEGYKRCVPHEDGKPKKSVYISTYRVLERTSPSAFKKLYLVTAYGQALSLNPSSDYPVDDTDLHLYQEITPVHPLVVSTQGPVAFYKFITDPKNMIHIPAICYVDLQLGALASDPEFGESHNLPYTYLDHLRECLLELQTKTIQNKMVNRVQSVEFPYRMIKSGIFVGNGADLVYFPMPSRDELRDKYLRWWRSANL